MALDPRTYLNAPNCEKSRISTINKTSDRKDFFGALGKVGNIEALNDIGATKVGQGLRTLSSISDSVRNGDGTPPTILGLGGAVGGSLDSGAHWVLGNVGIAASAVKTVGQFNPSVANTAYGNAKQIFQKVKQGSFRTTDIPNYFTSLQQLDTLSSNIFTPAKSSAESDKVCFATPYAEALAYEFAPKFKFLFVVEFIYNSDFATSYADIGQYTAFLVKTTTRPNIHFEYEEVNVYNFRTRFPKRTLYEPMTMTFYDDQANMTTEFFRTYLNNVSPVSNIGNDDQHPTVVSQKSMEQDSMNWLDPGFSASLGVLPGASESYNILHSINIYHLYDWGRRMNEYRFYNPKILEMSQDELDMGSSDASALTLQFAYDGVNILTDMDVKEHAQTLEDLTNFDGKPIKYRGLSTGNKTQAAPATPSLVDKAKTALQKPIASINNAITTAESYAKKTFDQIL